MSSKFIWIHWLQRTTVAIWVFRNWRSTLPTAEGRIELRSFRPKKNFVRFISKCGPRLSETASEKLRNQYVVMRNGTSIYEREVGKKTAIPITVRWEAFVVPLKGKRFLLFLLVDNLKHWFVFPKVWRRCAWLHSLTRPMSTKPCDCSMFRLSPPLVRATWLVSVR